MNAFTEQKTVLLSKLKEKYTIKSTIHLTFDLEIFWKIREKQEKKQGELILTANDKFFCRLGATKWISDGMTYWHYNEKTSQVIIKNLLDIDLSSHPSQVISTFLQYPYTYERSDKNEVVYRWVADTLKSQNHYNYESIIMRIDKEKIVIKSIMVIDKSGNESTYRIKKTKLNVPVSLTVFSFDIPKGADVLDTRF